MTPDYGFRITVPPATEPVPLAEAKAQCRVALPDEDALIAGYVLAARKFVEQHTGLLLLTQTCEMTLDAFPTNDYFEMARAPVQSVSSVTYVDTNGSPQTWPSANYVSDAFRGRPAVRLAYNASWPIARTQANAVTVTFVAGYGSNPGDAPEPIRQAMLLLIGHWYEHREAVNVGSTVNEFPLAVDSLLATYRVNWL